MGGHQQPITDHTRDPLDLATSVYRQVARQTTDRFCNTTTALSTHNPRLPKHTFAMDFSSGRMSMMRATQPSTGRKQQPEPDDAFMMVLCIPLSRSLDNANMRLQIARLRNRNVYHRNRCAVHNRRLAQTQSAAHTEDV
jgi:hypothetical protein